MAEVARPGIGRAAPGAETRLLSVQNLCKYFPIRKGIISRVVGHVHAVDRVSFSIKHGETYGLVGESGCGKTTTGRLILRLLEPTSGQVLFDGKDVFSLGSEEMRQLRRQMQIVFQDPYATLNKRMTVGELLAEPLLVHGVATGREARQTVLELMYHVGLQPHHFHSFPHEFSGGQRQRIGIARALMLSPKLVIADEPVSALDVSIRSQILNLMQRLQQDFGLTYLFISHDMSVVKHLCDRIGVMYLGRLVESAPKRKLFAHPVHPYTQALMGAIPRPNPRLRKERRGILQGDVPSPVNPPSGCHFHTRCPYVEERCRVESPAYDEVEPGHWVKCHLAQQLIELGPAPLPVTP